MKNISGRGVAGGLSVLLLAAPGAGWAQQDAGAPTVIEEIIVTAQRNNQTQVDQGGSVGVLGDKAGEDVPFSIKGYNAALILNQQPQTLGQVLENDPSVRTSYGFGNASEQFIIRGFVLTGDDVGFDGLYGLTPRQLVAPELYNQVQVLNGASAFLNGAAPGGSGIGGSVNLVPKRALGDLQRLTVNYTATSHVGGSFDVARRFGDGSVGVRVNGAFREGDVAIDDEYRSTRVLGGAFDYRGEALRLSLDLAYQRVEVNGLRPKVTIGTDAVPRVPDSDHNYAQRWSYSVLRDVFGLARLEYDLGPDTLLYAAAGARDGSEYGIYDGITITDVETGAATGSALYVPRTDNNEAAQAGIRTRLAALGLSHEINAGGSLIWQVNRNAYDFLGGFVPYETNLYDTPDVELPGSGFVGGDLDDPFPVERKRLSSLFLSDTIGGWDERVLFTAGLRLQTINVRNYSYADGSLSSEYDEDAVTQVYGIVVKPVEGVSLFANRIQGLAQGPTAPIDPTVVNAGEVFAPYKSTQYEIGGKAGLGPINASLALYRTDQPSAYSIPEPGEPGRVRYGVYGEQRNSGVELGLDGEPVDGLRIIAGASIGKAEYRSSEGGANDGNTAPGVPDYLVNANVEWDLPWIPALTLTGRVVRTGEQQVDAANALSIPEWTRVDLGARYVTLVAGRPLSLRFGVDNVADERYWASAFDAFSAQLLQGTPRTIKFSASFDL